MTRLSKEQLEKKYNVTIIERNKELVNKGEKYMISFSKHKYTDYVFKNLTDVTDYLKNQENNQDKQSNLELETVNNEEKQDIIDKKEYEYEIFLNNLNNAKSKKDLDDLVKAQIDFLKEKYPNIGTLSVKLSQLRKELKEKFENIETIPEIFRHEYKGKIQHLAIEFTYRYVPREQIEENLKKRKEISNSKLDNKISISKEDIEKILFTAKQGIYQRDDIYYAIASLELLTGRRFIENAKLLSDYDKVSNFKMLIKRTDLAKKHDNKEEILEVLTLEYVDSILDCIDWIRENFKVNNLTNEETKNRYLGTVNNRVKKYFNTCKKHDSDYPTSHTLRAYSANIAWYFYGNESKDKRKFIENYLAHDNDLSAKDYDRYYVDSNTFNQDEKQGYKASLIDSEDIKITVNASQLFKLEQYGIDELIAFYEQYKKEDIEEKEDNLETEQKETKEKETKEKQENRKEKHFDILMKFVKLIISYNEDKEDYQKIAITSRALYELSGKRTNIISDFMAKNEFINQYNLDNKFSIMQNKGKEIKKILEV